jgi:hypothetical protein
MPNGTPQSLPQVASNLPAAPPQTPPSFGVQLLGNKEFSVEFNDSVCDTISWRSSRYDGNQLETKNGINGSFSDTDKTFGKSSVVEKYSRCIYIGKQIIPHLEEAGGLFSVPPSIPFTGFKNKTVIQIEGFFQINSDDTITKITNFDNSVNTKRSTKNTIRTAIGDDFSLGSKAKLIVFDKAVEQNLRENYTVDFNEGSLARIAEISQSFASSSVPTFVGAVAAPNTTPDQNQVVPLFSFTFPTTQVDGVTEFNAGPNQNTKVTVFDNEFSNYYSNISGSGANYIAGNQATFSERFINLFLETQKVSNLDPANNKFYLEVKGPPTTNPQKYNTAAFGPNNFNLFEINRNSIDPNFDTQQNINAGISILGKSSVARVSNPFNLGGTFHFDTFSSAGDPDPSDPQRPANLMVLHRLNTNPAIIINMNTGDDLPNGVGSEGFVILPENLHPDIKNDIDKILVKDLGFAKEGFTDKNDINPFTNNRNNYGGFGFFNRNE